MILPYFDFGNETVRLCVGWIGVWSPKLRFEQLKKAMRRVRNPLQKWSLWE